MRSVLVTGGSRGVGRATVERLLADGWTVTAGCRDVAAATEVLPRDPALTVVRLDVTDHDEVRAEVRAAEERAGGALDVVVNNPAWALMGAVEDVDIDKAREMFETNFFGAAAVMQAALPAMRAAGGGLIVNVSSIGARITNPLLGMYHASKYALTALSEALAIEGEPFGIRVCVVEPGMIETDFPKATLPTGSVARGEGPYLPLLAELRPGFQEWRRLHGVPPEAVADVIAEVAADPAAPFRVPVGDDAVFLGETRDRLADREFHAELLAFLQIREWAGRD